MSSEFNVDSIDAMNREEMFALSERARALAWCDAQEMVAGMDLAKEVVLPRQISGLHSRTNEQYKRLFANLEGRFADQFPALLAYAQWTKWVSCWDGACWFRHSIQQGVMLNNEHTQSFCTASGYASQEGWAYTTSLKLAESNHHPVFEAMSERFCLQDTPSDEDVLNALELHWLWLASNPKIAREELLEFLHEAAEADMLATGLRMWTGGAECMLEEMASDPQSNAALSARRLLAKAAASARHAPNQALREQVVARYRAEKSQYSSKDVAAIAFTKDFPFEFSTIRGWLKGA